MKTFRLLSPAIIMCAMAMLASCGQHGNKKTSEETASDSTALQKAAPIAMNLSTGFAQMELYSDSMKSITLTFDSPGNEILYGRLVLPAEGAENIRFNQIIMPDSSMNGPFGRDITYELTAAGTYSLIIGESLMAGNPYVGKFIVELYTGAKVPYGEPMGYFVRNDVDTTTIKTYKIASKEEFEAVFGMGATMKSRPTPIDFSKEFAIAVVGKPTDVGTQYKVEALMDKGDAITLVYRAETGDKQSFTIRPFLLLTADKKFDKVLRTVEPMNL